jgi:hypothetical protein
LARAAVEAVEARVLLAGDPVISEFLAVNNNGLVDFEGKQSDWIEVHNPSAAPLNLEGYYLTDDPTPAGRTKWRFPAVTLPAGGYLVVFASDTMRNTAGGPLSTGFKLDGDGEYLGLIRPDLTVAHEYAPTFPPQEPDVSYGLGAPQTTTATLLGTGANARARVPDGSTGADWAAPGFNDASWTGGRTGVGYEDTSGPTPGLPNEIEPNDTPQTANNAAGNFSIAAGLNLYHMGIKGTVSPSGDGDFYNIGSLQPGDVLTVSQSASGSGRGSLNDSYLQLWRANLASPVLVVEEDDGGPGVDSLLHRFAIATDDTYFIRAAAHPNSGTGTYDLALYLENTAAAPATGGAFTSEVEPNNSPIAANNASSGWRAVQNVSRTAGTLSPGSADYFRYPFTAGDLVTVNLDSTSGLDAAVTLYDPTGNTVLAREDGDSTRPAPYDLDSTVWSYVIPATGAYYVKAEGVGGTSGGYSLETLLSSATPPATVGPFNGLIATDLRAQMQNVNASAYVRARFSYDPASLPVDRLTLRMKYDDGFVAYLNGAEIARRNAPGAAGTPPAYNAAATAEHPNAQGAVFEDIDVSAYKHLLVGGTDANVLAIHGLNLAASDRDFLVLPELRAVTPPVPQPPQYFTVPTPGAANSTGTNEGPAISNVTHRPSEPADADAITVAAKIASTGNGVGAVSLVYRVMYDAEITTPMFDDGAHGDGRPGDGVYGASIPAAASSPGQMVRWRVVAADPAARQSKAPLHPRPDTPEYFGTVIADPSLASTLPIFQFFTQFPGAVGSGNRVSLWYRGEFYDSVFCRDRGGGTTDGLKFDFNPDHRFLWDPAQQRVDEINLNYRSQPDESYLRALLSFEAFRDAGHPAVAAFPMRMQMNGTFWKEATFIENPDQEFLERVGLDGNGALYKAVNDHPTMTSTGAYEKKTRRDEPAADLQEFFDGIHLTGQAQVNYLFDNFDIPGFLTYWAVNTIVNDNDDVQKNFFLYRDTEGDGRWRFIAWDKDLTFGKHFGIGDYAATDPQTHPFFGDSSHPKRDGSYAWNWLVDALLDIPVVKEMYRRRLRSVMDELLQPASTPPAQRHFENRLDQLYAQLSGDPQVLQYLGGATRFQTAINNIKTRYLDARRNHLYVDHAAGNSAYPDNAAIPTAQPATFPIEIGAIDVSPASGDQRQEYIQLINRNSFAADVSGWTLSDAVDYTLDFGTVIPAGGSLYVAANVAGFRARTSGPGGNRGLLVIGGYDGQLSARGETIVLKDAAGGAVASLTYPANPTPAQQALRVSEVMYRPASPPAASAFLDPEEYEFVEVQNISQQALNLGGMKFTLGFDAILANVTLQPGAYGVVVRNRAAFTSRYGAAAAANIVGDFPTDHLDNIGERIRLEDATGEVILDFNYSPAWHPATDGGGRSLVIKSAGAPVGTWGDAGAWRPSGAEGGSPGAADAPDSTPPAVTSAMFDPAGPNHRVRVTFTEPVSVASAASLSVSGVGGTRAANSVTFDPATRTATFTFPGILPDGNYTATLSPAGTTDPAGLAMQAGHSFAFFALAGDLNRDRSVSGTDFAILAGNFGKIGMTFAQGDLNGDGAVNGGDFAILAGNFGRQVPQPGALEASAVAAPAPAPTPAPTPTAVPTPVRRRTAPAPLPRRRLSVPAPRGSV